MSKTIQYSVDADGIAILTLDVPGRSMNVLTPELVEDLKICIEKLAGDQAVKGAVITAAKTAFMAGADLKDLVTAYDRGLTVEEGYYFGQSLSQVFRRLETCGKPVAAAINGIALGGGLELCLACHYRVLTDDRKAKIGLPEVTIGLLPGAGGTQRLPRLIGIREALPLMLEGRQLTPDKALKLGVVHELAPLDQLVERCRCWVLEKGDPEAPWDKKGFRVPGGAGAMHPKSMETFMVGTSLLAGNAFHNYPAPKAIMSAVYEGTITPFDTGLQIEGKYFAQLISGVVARNMMRTLFVNKGEADKLVRRPDAVEKSAVKKLGVLGAGMMGAGVAYVSARAGIEVILLDTDLEGAEKGKAYSQALLEKGISRGKSTRDKADALLRMIRPTTDYADLEGCDLVIEAVFESREIKAEVTAQTEAVIPETAIFASNTSTLPITGLAEASERPEKFIGIHFFSPVDKMPLVEIIVGKKTSDEAIARSLDYVQQLRKTPIVVNDSRGFYTSRCFMTFCNEGMTMVSEGISPALIENVAKMTSMPVGPLAVIDEVTIELAYKVSRQAEVDLGKAFQPISGLGVVKKMVDELDRKGKRYGKGFYEYPEGGQKHLWPGLAEHYPLAAEQPSVDEIKNRLLIIQALETARCYEEGVLTHPAEADLGSIFGWGFPPWTGGTLSFIDTMGIGKFISECDRMAEIYGPRFEVSDWLRARAEKGETFHPIA
ncbi:MAG TPA: 3-hydroxyacyl-CoA dehydrogenase NAD-binding domain-containing protein [Gammaproteobacteria bacterium]|jgi:3-hydroxyacyl-CoA dehydrogenase/enoyl-CoA hydratase/3-hydroxybutyryl-CoA epimerase|nr:3-hydroxyacyl-CoA dehydrogenase [Chromatiales bacterium]MCP4926148.1 3-hydroxyacyl-CoA dehydrogenase [Gammaproteobacteria bacterium]HJP38252.1 3-hydroxyacyl-CoA dehydrogenase NAD-binding domain-containing protein [Gammaproteobacteria bacterium]